MNAIMPRTREQMDQAAREFEAWSESLDLADPDVTVRDPADMRAIGRALQAITDGERELTMAVDQARANGRSWAEIGMVLGVSKQAAAKRFAPSAPAQREAAR